MSIFAGGRKAGFTLLEILVVVMIMGILTSIALPNYRRSVQRARVAEAQTLLRAIYDSCERLAWENSLKNCGAAVTAGKARFNKLDIMVKGTYEGNGTQLRTGNFLYTLGSSITAQSVTGDYSGAKVTFTGQKFICTPGASGEPANACKVWGADTWNEN